MIRVKCPNCGADTAVEEGDMECDGCGEEVPRDDVRSQVAARERQGVPVEPTRRES